MIRTQVSFDEGMYRDAREEARRQGISFAELCRRALQQTLPPRDADRPWMRHAGALVSGDAGASRSVDEIVYGRDRP